MQNMRPRCAMPNLTHHNEDNTMKHTDRPFRLLGAFAALLEDHRKDFDGFVRDVENVRFGRTALDGQQKNRLRYALNNMGLLLIDIQDCIKSGMYDGDELDVLVQTKNDWLDMKRRVDDYMASINQIEESTERVLQPLRVS